MITKNITEIANTNIEVTAPLNVKRAVVNAHLDKSKYTLVGFVDRTNTAILQERYYNVRDAKGRFACTRVYRRATNGTFTK
jgi:hypothetical protein